MLVHVLRHVDYLCNTIEWPVDVLEKMLDMLEGLWAMVAASAGYESELTNGNVIPWRSKTISIRVTRSLLRVSTLMHSILKKSTFTTEGTTIHKRLLHLLREHLAAQSLCSASTTMCLCNNQCSLVPSR